MADADILFPSTFGKLETQTLGVSNLKIFHMIDIYKMVVIFQFFHNGQHCYFISLNTQKTGDPNFGGFSNLRFFHMIDIYKMMAIFLFS